MTSAVGDRGRARGSGVAGDGVTAPVPRVVRRARELTGALVLCALAFSQAGGLLVADTKLDLVLDPAGFLARALQAWDPQAAFGQVQNQAYGYLWPMGPFFLLGHALHIPGWMVQRLWWCLVLLVAYAGMLVLLRLLRVGTPTSRLLGALVFALSPRILTTLGGISVESWPSALVPWILVPLVVGAQRGSPRRAAALSAVAVACLGGVNATASAAAAVIPLLFLLTREPGPRRRSLLLWWSGLSALAVAWWIAPLLLMSRYSYPFLAYIESAATTTAPLSALDNLRGTDHWLGFLVLGAVPSWPAGWWLSTIGVAVLATSVLAALGLLGLLVRSCPERRLLRLSLLLGVLVLGVGYVGALGSPVSPWVHSALDGWAAPLRNVHKFDVLLRLPLSVGVAVLVPALVPSLRRILRPAYVDPHGAELRRAAGVVAVALVVVPAAVVVSPALRGELPQAGSFAAVPAAWQDAADWLTAHGPQDRTLLLPASNFGEYTWGHPRDEPFQALAQSPWGVRNIVPLGAPGLTRWLDGVQQVVATGASSELLAPALREAGVRYVVVRSDLDPATGVVDPVLARATVATSPGLTRVASFGEPVPRDPAFEVVGATAQPQLEVYEVTDAADLVTAYPASAVSVFSGGPEALVTAGLAGRPGPWVALADATTDGVTVAGVVTDTLRRRVMNVGAQRGSDYTPTLTADTPVSRGDAAGDVSPWPAGTDETTLEYVGIDDVAASSTAADPFAVGHLGADRRPFSALDGLASTAWLASTSDRAPWWRVRFSPREVSRVRLVLATPDLVRGLRVTTDSGSVDVVVGDTRRSAPVDVAVRPGRTSTVRVDLVLGPRRTQQPGLAEVSIPGVTAAETVRVAAPVGTAGAVLSVAPGARRACTPSGDGWACSSSWSRAGEEVVGLDRTFTTHGPATWQSQVRVTAVAGSALDTLLDRADGFDASASSAYVGDPAARPGAALDSDPSTAWIPSTSDVTPRLDVSYPAWVTATGIRVTDGSVSDDGLSEVVVTAQGRTLVVPLVNGTGSFPALTDDAWRLTFRRAPTADGRLSVLRIQVVLEGVTAGGAGRVDLPCASGPSVVVDGVPGRLAVSASVADVLRKASLPTRACGEAGTVSVGAGRHRMTAVAHPPFAVTAVALSSAVTTPTAAEPLQVTVTAWAPESRSFTVPAGPEAVVVLGEGFNPGWTASVAGETVTPVRLDGWRQAWRVPASTTERSVVAVYTPGTTQRAALAVGGLLLLVVVAVALRRGTASLAPVGAAGARRGETVALTLLVPALVASWIGLLVGAVALGSWRLASPGVRAVAAAGSLVAAGVVGAVFSAPWGVSAAAGAAQLLAVVTVALVAVSGRDDRSSARTARDPGEDRVLDEEPGRESDDDAAHDRQ